MLKASLSVVLLIALTLSYVEGQIIRYDAQAVKRFDDELRRLGIILPSVTKPEESDIDPTEPTVSCPAGDFEGYWTQSQFARRIAAFEGMPYAQPPVGPLRFKEAQPASPVTVFKAKKPGTRCTQSDLFGRSSQITGQEDCLYINVYVPEKALRPEAELLPVMFLVHEGGFVAGRGDVLGGKILLDKDILFVSFNYRVGPLGFLTTEDEAIPGNLGLKDQVAALRWIHENIESFGGNPNLVTILGHSAGGVSSEYHMLSPLSKGLVHRVIAMSGSSLAPWALAPPGEAGEHCRKAAASLNCPVEPSSDLLVCLQTKTAEEITATSFGFKEWEGMYIPFKPVIEGEVDGAFLPHHPRKLLADGPANNVPFMASITSEEGSFASVGVFLNDTVRRDFDERFSILAPISLFLSGPNEKSSTTLETLRRAYFGPGSLKREQIIEASNLYTDVFFVLPRIRWQEYRRKDKAATNYLYYFSYEGSRSFLHFWGYEEKYGVCHGDDLLYLFSINGTPKPESQDVLMSMLLTDLYTSFARDGVPSSIFLNTEWLPVSTNGTDMEFLHIKSPLDIRMEKDLIPERWNLVKALFEAN